jgi:hypothetical protein
MDRNKHLVAITVLWLMAVGLFIRVWGLHTFYFSPDDMTHLEIAPGKDLGQVWKSSLSQIHPPLIFYILHYMLKISRNEYFLEGVSLLPGVGLIGIFFLLGRKTSGLVSGVVMAYIAAFSYGAVILSEVIRPYSLLLFLVSVGLYSFISYLIEGKGRHLLQYALCLFLASSLHYSAVVPMAGLGMVWLGWAYFQKKGVSEYLRISAVHLPAAAVLGLSYPHVARIFDSGYYWALRQVKGYIDAYFADSLHGLLLNTVGLYGYLFLPPLAIALLAASLFGLWSLEKSARRAVTAMILVIFMISMILNLANIYPYGGTRHCIYFLPFVSLSIGAFFQSSFDLVFGKIKTGSAPRFLTRLASRKEVLANSALIAVMLSTIPATYYAHSTNFLRGYPVPGFDEFPVKREDYQKTIAYLLDNVKPGDVILTNLQSSAYITFASGRGREHLGDHMLKMSYLYLDIYYYNIWTYDTDRQYEKALHGLGLQVDLTKTSRLWLLNIGWGEGFPSNLPKKTIFNSNGVGLYLIEGRNIFQ